MFLKSGQFHSIPSDHFSGQQTPSSLVLCSHAQPRGVSERPGLEEGDVPPTVSDATHSSLGLFLLCPWLADLHAALARYEVIVASSTAGVFELLAHAGC